MFEIEPRHRTDLNVPCECKACRNGTPPTPKPAQPGIPPTSSPAAVLDSLEHLRISGVYCRGCGQRLEAPHGPQCRYLIVKAALEATPPALAPEVRHEAEMVILQIEALPHSQDCDTQDKYPGMEKPCNCFLSKTHILHAALSRLSQGTRV